TVEFCLEDLQNKTQYTHSTNILDYIIPSITSSSLNDTTPIAFENGKIVPDEKQQSTTKTVKILLLLLAKTYGVLLTESVMKRYQIFDKPIITFDTLKRILLGISANVKITDLIELFNEIKNNCPKLHCSKLLLMDETKALQQVKDFESL